jgi:hypothetical protein
MTRSTIVAGLLILTAALSESASAQAARGDPMAGTWVLNVARSTYAPGTTPPRASSYRYENRPDGFTLWVAATVNATGNPGFSYSLRKYDGKEYPTYTVASLTGLFMGGARPAATQSSRLTDARSTELFNRTDGVITQRVTRTMAPDGKSFTMRTYAPTGELQNTTIWEKVEQPPQT